MMSQTHPHKTMLAVWMTLLFAFAGCAFAQITLGETGAWDLSVG